MKFIEEPDRTVREFDSWQQYLAYKLLEIAKSGLTEGELIEVAEAVGFNHAPELLSLLREMAALSDREIEQRAERFIREVRPSEGMHPAATPGVAAGDAGD